LIAVLHDFLEDFARHETGEHHWMQRNLTTGTALPTSWLEALAEEQRY
jgi:hypothetical protein